MHYIRGFHKILYYWNAVALTFNGSWHGFAIRTIDLTLSSLP